jgi:hypothetical protein
MSIALKAYYSLWVVLTWGLLAIILIGLSGQSSRAWWRWLLVGVAAGYIAGILVYQIAPAIMAGSVHNALAIMRAGGLLTHIGLSMLVPLMTMSWLLGLITAAMFAAVKRHSGHDIRVALYIVGTVVICGWVFFLAQQRIPVKW